jgi:hypothetical protein
MREVSSAITRMMCSSGIAMLLRQIALCLAELVRSAEAGDRVELGAIHERIEARRQESSALRASIAEERQSLASFEARATALQNSFKDIESHFDKLVSSATQMLRHELGNMVREYADHQADSLLVALETDRKLKAWRCDVVPLREQLETAYLTAFQQAVADLAHVERFLYPQLKVIVSSLLPGYTGNLLEVPVWPPGLTPSVAPLSDKVAVDLGTSVWQRWFAVRKAAEERAAQLRTMIEDDFFRIADELVATADAHLKERVDYIMQRVNAIATGLRTGIERRNANLEREQTLLDGTADRQALEQEQKAQAEDCVRNQRAHAAALDELNGVLQVLDAAQGETVLQ